MTRQRRCEVVRARRSHSIRRADERYDAILDHRDLEKLAVMVRKNKGKFLRRMTGTKTEWLVELEEGRLFRVVYSSSTKQIITFLPHRKGSDHE